MRHDTIQVNHSLDVVHIHGVRAVDVADVADDPRVAVRSTLAIAQSAHIAAISWLLSPM